MLVLDPVLISYFASGQPIVEETYVWIKARNLVTGAPEPFGFWTGEYTQIFSVLNRVTGDYENRQYLGGKAIEVVPVITGTPTLNELDSIAFQFDASNTDVQDKIRGRNLRRAEVEVHEGYYDPSSTKLVANPILVYLGLVNDGDEDVDGINPDGGESDPPSITLTFIPHIRGFKPNAKTRSHHTGKGRSGDSFYKWVNVAGGWALRWGKKKKSVGNKRKNSGGKGKGHGHGRD